MYWCAGDQLALKILQLTNDPKNIVIGGFDWLPVILEKIQQKEITASVGGHFLMVAIALVNIVDYEAGQNVFIEDPKLYKFELITAKNVDSHISFFNNKGWNKVDFSHYLTSKNKHAPPVTISNLMEQVNQNE